MFSLVRLLFSSSSFFLYGVVRKFRLYGCFWGVGGVGKGGGRDDKGLRIYTSPPLTNSSLSSLLTNNGISLYSHKPTVNCILQFFGSI